MKGIRLIFLAVFAFVCSQEKPAVTGIDLQAHRGGAALMPENTFSSMKNALELGVNTLEMDLQLSADEQVVVSHDNYFHRRCSIRPDGTLIQKGDPKEYLYTMPYDSIASYEVGLRPTEQWPRKKLISEHVPLASDLLDFTEKYARELGRPLPGYNIEIKSSPDEGEGTFWPDYREFCDRCIPLLLSKNLGERLVVQSFDVRSLEYIHKNWPQVALSFLTKKDTGIEDILSRLSFSPQWWSPHYSVVTADNVAYCHSLGIKVVPWTVDDPCNIRRVAGCGVDAIISNEPAMLIAIIGQEGYGYPRLSAEDALYRLQEPLSSRVGN